MVQRWFFLKRLFYYQLIILSCLLFPQICIAQFGGGSGTEEDPYLLYTPEHLQAIGENQQENAFFHYKMMNDIDLSGYDGKEGRPEFNMITYWAANSNDDGFRGVFDGNGFLIHNFSYEFDQPNTNIFNGTFALFKRIAVTGVVKNVGLSNTTLNTIHFGNTDVFMGALCGVNKGIIENCYVVDSSVTNHEISRSAFNSALGGLVSLNYGTIHNSFVQNTLITSAGDGHDGKVGGVVGENLGDISKSFSQTTVNASLVGGFVGKNSGGQIDNCYTSSTVTTDIVNISNQKNAGGLAAWTSGKIVNCYSTSSVASSINVGGMFGINHGEIYNCFWNTDVAGQTSSDGGIGVTTAQMQSASTFTDWYCGWKIDEGIDYPRLEWENLPGTLISPSYSGQGTASDPIQIESIDHWYQLGLCPCDWDSHIEFTNDLDFNDYPGFDPNRHPQPIYYQIENFGGTINGNHHAISNFSYQSSQDNIGLIGSSKVDSEIKNISMVDPNVMGIDNENTGALIGELKGSIENCHIIGGSVVGNKYVGGLVGGRQGSKILHSSAISCAVSGIEYVGGLIGFSSYTQSCHSSCNVDGQKNIGGIAGYSQFIKNCFSDSRIHGSDRYVGGIIGTGNAFQCYSSGEITGLYEVGGIVGSHANVVSCYSTADVSGEISVGGIAGSSETGAFYSVRSCYANGLITGDSHVGGLVGANGNIINSYFYGQLFGSTNVGGLVGSNSDPGKVQNSFWDTDVSGVLVSAGGTGKTTIEMLDPNLYLNAGWDVVGYEDQLPSDDWVLQSGNYPQVWWQADPNHLAELPVFSGGIGGLEDPFLISTYQQWNQIGDNPRLMDKHFSLINDIDVNYQELISVGSEENPFIGVFDGNGFVLSNITRDQVLFPKIGIQCSPGGILKNLKIKNIQMGDDDLDVVSLVENSYGMIKNVSMKNVQLQGQAVSGFVKNNYGYISNCSIRGLFSRAFYRQHGLVEYNSGKILDCYVVDADFELFIFHTTDIGGLVGTNEGEIKGCYTDIDFVGNSNSPKDHACLVLFQNGFLSESYFDREDTNPYLGSRGCDTSWLMGCKDRDRLTSEMQTQSTFENWDFDNVWKICEGLNFPILQWESLPGDIDCSLSIGTPDLTVLADVWLSNVLHHDQQQDGFIDMKDWALYVANPSQQNLSASFVQEWLTPGVSLKDCAPNGGDNIFNMIDFSLLSSNWLEE